MELPFTCSWQLKEATRKPQCPALERSRLWTCAEAGSPSGCTSPSGLVLDLAPSQAALCNSSRNPADPWLDTHRDNRLECWPLKNILVHSQKSSFTQAFLLVNYLYTSVTNCLYLYSLLVSNLVSHHISFYTPGVQKHRRF